MSKKKELLENLFEYALKNNTQIIDNKVIKDLAKQIDFKNPFDATKIDYKEQLPEIFLKNDTFILHLGEGRHKFVKGIRYAFHYFEQIPKNQKFIWKYKKSILNELDTSESNILSLAYNQRIIHDFLYNDIVANPKMYMSRRTKIKELEIKINGNTEILKNIQIEIDLTLEYNGIVTIFEAKNKFRANFATYQIFFPFLYYKKLNSDKNLGIKEINSCYLLRQKEKDKSIVRLYLYKFETNDFNSLKFIKSAEYTLKKV